MMEEDDDVRHPFELSQPPSSSVLTVDWFYGKKDQLLVAAFAILVIRGSFCAVGAIRLSAHKDQVSCSKGPLRPWYQQLRESIQTGRQGFEFTMLLFVFAFVGRVWRWLMDQLQTITDFFWGLMDRGGRQKNTRNREIPALLCDDEDETQVGTAVGSAEDDEVDASGMSCSDQSHGSESRIRPRNDAIEPAFLRENEYPKDWLVYHPVLRVVLKTVADRYDRGESIEEAEEVSDTEEKKEEPSEYDEKFDALEVEAARSQDDARRNSNDHRATDHDRISPKSPCPAPSPPSKGSSNEVFPIQHSVAAN